MPAEFTLHQSTREWLTQSLERLRSTQQDNEERREAARREIDDLENARVRIDAQIADLERLLRGGPVLAG